ncbi:hypothetical protein PS1_030105 [Malus domestica]
MASNTIRVEGLLGMLTIKLNDKNFSKWVYQFKSVMKEYKMFGHFDGTAVCPSKFVVDSERGVTNMITEAFLEWESIDLVLLSLLIATLSNESIEHVLGYKTAHGAWSNLQDRYASVSKARVNTLKTEFQTIQKGGDSIDQYLSKLRNIKDQLIAANESISDNDFVVAALSGLPREYSTIRTVIFTRDNPITLKEFKEQLLCAEREIESMVNTLPNTFSGLYMQGSSSQSMQSQGSSSNSGNVPFTTGGTLTRVPSEGSNLSLPYQPPGSVVSPFTSQGFSFPATTFPSNGFMHSPAQYPSSSFVMPRPSSMYSDFSNSYGFVGNGPAPRPFNNSNASSRPFFGQKSNRGYRGSNFGNNRGQSSGTKSSTNNWQPWSSNTETRSYIVPECQICSKRGHTAPNCWKRSTNPNQ